MVGANAEERAKFAERAAEDWENILLARAAEMKTGAQFIVLNFGIDELGRYLGNTGGHSMFEKFNAHWRTLLDAGTITPDEFRGQHSCSIIELLRNSKPLLITA